ncbi:MAG: PTS-dependent dihydroxyacetone kinase operon transcriptional regulator DhaR [Anaerolineales bacterium]|nr:PTS-dependent dihydroxyacetone kinase operon transcriptional regulator DhaR [Anaerolineales bacterium]MCA9932028.1 PTS-dependent dihydroxyacetone kinase operon transcriptional regulator DhaR [Anaerolineales bacterium]
MQPSSYPIEFGILRNYWRQFVQNGEISVIDTTPLDPAVYSSWQRCKPRVDPYKTVRPTILKGGALGTLLRSHSELMSMAIPFMEDMHQFMEGSDSAILITDGSGCVLAMEGDAAAKSMVQARDLGVGAYWSEGSLGTNALGISLLTTMPMQVVGAEHYFQQFHDLTTTAAPIHDVNGRNIAIIAVVNLALKSTSHTLSLVMAVARAISNQLQANLYLAEANHHLTELRTILSTMTEGVIAWNADKIVTHVNKQAGKLLEVTAASALGQPIGKVIKLPRLLQDAVDNYTELHDVELSIALAEGARRENVLVSLHVIAGFTASSGQILMLRPIEQVRRIVHQQVGSNAMLKLDDVLALSPSMRPVLRQARIAARGNAPVLLQGEGGVGKNHLARAIHNAGDRASHPFIAIDCHALPRELLMSELLGYGQDAEQNERPSKFELVNGGTIFLDRVENLSMEMQSALLHIVETGHVLRLGSFYPVSVDVRIIVATSANLADAVAAGTFLSHLYYRFGVFHLKIPPLRERVEDVPLLVERFLSRLSKAQGKQVHLTDSAFSVLHHYPWPGNVRELEMVLERAIYLSQDGRIDVVHIPEVVRNGRVVTGSYPDAQPVLSASEAEREAILRAGWANKGHVTEMAKQLGIGRTTLWRKMKRHNITTESFK